MATLSWSGSNTAPVVPTAASTRPQFGSSPAMAHLSRLQRATARPAVTASSTVAAPVTSMAIVLLAPSASCCICLARSAQAAVSSLAKSPGSGWTAAAPLASSSTVSLVDMQPSVSSRSKVVLHRLPQRGVQLRGAQIGVGGEHDQHGGQRRRQHGRALGHAAHRVAGPGHAARLRDGVGGPDRIRRRGAAVGRCGRHRRVHAGQQPVHRQPVADQAGRADRDLPRRRR